MRGDLSTGEGLIHQVRDPVERLVGHGKDRHVEVVDEGVEDKRLLVESAEFAATLRMMRRDGNTLSAVVRQAWDRGDLRATSKTNPSVATGAAVAVSGHITVAELRRELCETDAASGFANRFLLTCVKRSKVLPDGGEPVDTAALAAEAGRRLAEAREVDRMRRDAAASALWHRVYPALSAERPGLLGAVTGRAEAQVLRLSMIYALLDGTGTVGEAHLRAALELWRYCRESVSHIFGAALGDHVADTILAALRANPEGLGREAIHGLFSRHETAARIKVAVAELVRSGHAALREVPTGGRPREVLVPLDPRTPGCEESEFGEERSEKASNGVASVSKEPVREESEISEERVAGEGGERPRATPPAPAAPGPPPTFTPTADWQDLPEDAVLPPGCQTEVDLATGRRRARLHPEGVSSWEAEISTAAATLAAARAAGVRVVVNGGALRLVAERAPPPALIEAVRADKLEILAALAQVATALEVAERDRPPALELTPTEPEARAGPQGRAPRRSPRRAEARPAPPPAGEVAAGPPPVEYEMVGISTRRPPPSTRSPAAGWRSTSRRPASTRRSPRSACSRWRRTASPCSWSTPAPAAASRPWPARSPASARSWPTARCSRPRFLRRAGVRTALDCSQVAEQLLSGLKHVPTSLAAAAERRLGLELDKSLPGRGLGRAELSESQLRYAATDAAVTLRLWEDQERAMAADGCGRAYALARDAQPCVARMRLAGVPFDRAAHAALIDGKRPERDRLFGRIGHAFRGSPRSYARFDAWLLHALDEEGVATWPRTDAGHLRSDVDTLKNCLDLLPARDRPTVLRLLAFRDLDKVLTTYGASLAALLRPGDDRFSPGLRVAATVSGRMTCSEPNLQNIPRDPAFRALFRARAGRRFVVCDYSRWSCASRPSWRARTPCAASCATPTRCAPTFTAPPPPASPASRPTRSRGRARQRQGDQLRDAVRHGRRRPRAPTPSRSTASP